MEGGKHKLKFCRLFAEKTLAVRLVLDLSFLQIKASMLCAYKNLQEKKQELIMSILSLWNYCLGITRNHRKPLTQACFPRDYLSQIHFTVLHC